MSAIEIALALLIVHAALGAFDTFYNHEWDVRLPHRPGAAPELALHSLRSLAFVCIFLGAGWFEWRGGWGWALLGLLGVEYLVTLADSVVEDRTRSLSPIERVNHMLLGLNTGLYTAFVAAEVATHWRHRPGGVVPVPGGYGIPSWLLTVAAAGVAAWAMRDALAAWRLRRSAPTA